ncbi:hypothetical protein GJAV_G00132060 [Gymnothorax javanicus]|nr:hypothetical protein GJAV_G00132060 [Gymnothorax javanicus]
MRDILIFVILPLYFARDSDAVPAKISGVFCTFKEKTYSPGDSWHPYLEPYGIMFCMRCACTETGHVKCNTIKCPVLRCEKPVTDAQQCCPRCTDQNRSPAGLRAVKVCRHNGTVYQPGETFSNHDLFPSRSANQCVICTCSNGNIFCALKTCVKLTCSSPVSVPDTCCLVCKEDGGQQLNRGARHSKDQCLGEHPGGRAVWASPSTPRVPPWSLNLQGLRLKGAAGTTVQILMQKGPQRACVYSGKTYSHGDVWHPVLGRVLECILCRCTDGVQECERITCPSQYPCQHPVKTQGKCCKTCPVLKGETNRTLCFLENNHSSLLVYKFEPASEADTKGSVRIIAIERQGMAEVEVQVWKIDEDTGQIGELQKKDLAEHPENYILLTTFDEETWKQFKAGAKKGKEFPKSRMCEEGIKEVLKFLNPEQQDILCTS